MGTFLSSFALILVAQIPLLLKLWLDYRGKLNNFRQELHKRQLEIYPPLAAQLNVVHDWLAMVGTTFDGVASWGDEETKKFAREFTSQAIKDNLALNDLCRRAELILPAPVVIALHEYIHESARMMGSVYGIKPLHPQSIQDGTSAWRRQQQRFDAVVNLLRFSVGTDALTNEFLREVHSGNRFTAINTSGFFESIARQSSES
jgi:hypothetical protein